mgnify:CR=1 FL=1
MDAAREQTPFTAKPTRCAVAAVVRHPEDRRRFLAVRRPPTDDELPNVWGLPAITLRPGELPEQGLRRVGREKLAAEIEPTRFVGIKAADRGTYELILMVVEARLSGAAAPSVSEARPEGTAYVAQQWTEDPFLLQEAAQNGSLCSQVFLEAEEVGY